MAGPPTHHRMWQMPDHRPAAPRRPFCDRRRRHGARHGALARGPRLSRASDREDPRRRLCDGCRRRHQGEHRHRRNHRATNHGVTVAASTSLINPAHWIPRKAAAPGATACHTAGDGNPVSSRAEPPGSMCCNPPPIVQNDRAPRTRRPGSTPHCSDATDVTGSRHGGSTSMSKPRATADVRAVGPRGPPVRADNGSKGAPP